MAQSIWTGAISFGLVSVPVRMVSATKSKSVSFNQLEKGTGARIRYKRVSEASGEEVKTSDIVKGYEISPGQYVVVEGEEIDALAPKKTSTIEILDFVDLADIDPIFFDTPYYVTPDKAAGKPYRLLVETMERLQKIAIGRVVLRNKEHLVAIRPFEGLLCVEMMRWADEIVDPAGLVEEIDAQPSERELKMAEQLVESLSGVFAPEQYRDEYRDQLLELIEKKAAGEEIVAEPETEETGKVLDLMAALKASLDRSKGTAASDDVADDDEDDAESPAPANKATKKAAGKKAGAKKAAAKKAARRRSA